MRVPDVSVKPPFLPRLGVIDGGIGRSPEYIRHRQLQIDPAIRIQTQRFIEVLMV